MNIEECVVDNGGCSDRCDVHDGQGVVCSCPNGGDLKTDNKTCGRLKNNLILMIFVGSICQTLLSFWY